MSNRSVCLIDADQNLNAYLVEELGRYGLRVDAYADANEVMARKDDLPSLIVLCIDPKRTGWAVCNRLRKSALLKSTPLVITSAEATEKDFEDHKKLKTRAEDYLHKPFGVEALVEKIATLIGLPEPAQEDLGIEVPIEEEEEIVEEEGVLVEDAEDLSGGFDTDAHASGFVNEDSADRTRIGTMNMVDEDVNVETDAAFAALGMDDVDTSALVTSSETELAAKARLAGVHTQAPAVADTTTTDDPFSSEDSPFDTTSSAPPTAVAKPPSVDLDLGLDDVAKQAAERPIERPRRASSPAPISSAPAPQPAHDTTTHDASASLVAELKAERDRLKRELEELRSRPQAKAEGAPAGGGYSREREFLNLREIINKKEKEILDLRDANDAKERQILDSKDKLRELERRARDLDEKVLHAERELVGAKEKVEALTHDKERVVEREKQVKGRLDDALRTIQRYEDELEGWKKKHADEVAQLEQSYNDAVAAHQAEVQQLTTRHRQAMEAQAEQAAAQLREAIDAAEAEKDALRDRYDGERGRMETEHARAIQQLRESKENEREGLRARYEQQIADLTEQHRAEVHALHEQYAQELDRLKAEHEGLVREKDEVHADEMAGLRARMAQEAKATERRHAEALAELDEQRKQELAAAEERRLQELAAKDEEHRAEMDTLAREHLVEKARMEREHEQAVQALDERHAGELRNMAAAHAEELERTRQEAEQKLADELKAARDSHMRKIQALEESHADLKAGMQQRHAQQIDDLKKEHAAAIAEYEAALKERDALITEGNDKINELEAQLSGERDRTQRNSFTIADLEQSLQNARNDISERDQRLSERAQRIGELEQESAGYQDQILKAYQRIKSDESIVSRAKKALAIALTLLDESAPDGSDEATS